jgi:hypothetical protein
MSTPAAALATAADWPAVADLRHRVFLLEQGVPAQLERDDVDATALHVLSRDDGGRVLARQRSSCTPRWAPGPASSGPATQRSAGSTRRPGSST